MKPLMSVGLVDVGERLPLSLAKLAKTLNELQGSYQFAEADVLTSVTLGKPDIMSKYFEIPRLLSLLREKCVSNHDFLIGVTNRRLTDTAELRQFDDPDHDYFSRSDLNRHAIVGLHDDVFRHSRPGTTLEQYAAFLIIDELLIMTAKINLNHEDNPDCALFECGDRPSLGHCIELGRICSVCRSALERANVSVKAIASAEDVLKWASRTSWRYAFKSTFENPAVTLILGTGLGWLAFLVPQKYFPIVATATLVPIFVAIFVTRWMRHGRGR